MKVMLNFQLGKMKDEMINDGTSVGQRKTTQMKSQDLYGTKVTSKR